jgi:hypothetical protein
MDQNKVKKDSTRTARSRLYKQNLVLSKGSRVVVDLNAEQSNSLMELIGKKYSDSKAGVLRRAVKEATGPASFFVAEVDTRNFNFRGVGVSEDAAIESLKRGLLEVHSVQFEVEDAQSWVDEVIADASVLEYVCGSFYRDREPAHIPKDSS